MIKYEIKKMLSKKLTKFLILGIFIFIIIFSFFAIQSVVYVDENGVEHSNIKSARNLASQQSQWKGDVTEEILAKVITNRKQVYQQYANNIPNSIYGSVLQSQNDVTDMVNSILRGMGEYDYYAILNISSQETSQLYDIWRRNQQMFINEYGNTLEQREFLNRLFDAIKTPFYYEPFIAWETMIPYARTVSMVLVLLLIIPVAELFTDEFHYKADSVFYTSKLGRCKAIKAKIKTAFIVSGLLYWSSMIFLSVICFTIMGISGGSVLFSFNHSYSLYPISYFKGYLLVLLAGYVASVLATSVTMLLAICTKKVGLAIFMPFLLFAVSPFIGRELPLKTFFQLTPDQLINVPNCMRSPYFYQISGIVFRQIPFTLIFYTLIALLLIPLSYRKYRQYQ